MRIKLKRLLALILSVFLLISGGFTVSAKVVYGSDAAALARSHIEKIIEFNLENDGVSDLGTWIGEILPERIGGTSEWYVIAISQYLDHLDNNIGKALFSYEKSLERYLSEKDEKNATARLKYALALAASGCTEADAGAVYIKKCISDGTIGGLGIMSMVFGLHLANNGYADSQKINELVTAIIAEQHKDGGWSVIGDNGDVDVTAMVLQALAPCVEIYDITSAAERGLDFLSGKQLESGAYSGFGIENAESTAQVLACLSSLGIDCTKDGRFIKNSNTVLDGILSFSADNGSFSHEQGGGYSATATVQAFYSLVSYVRMTQGLGPLYVLDSCKELREGAKENVESGTGTGQEESGIKDPDSEEDISVEENGQEGDSLDNKPAGDAVTERDLLTGETKNTNIDSESGQNLELDREIENNPLTKNDKQTITNLQTDNNRQSAEEKGIDGGSATKNKKSGNYKIYAIIAIIALSLISCAVIAIRKKHWKNYVFTVIVAAAAILIVAFTDLKSAASYYSGSNIEKENIAGVVTMSIRCDILKDFPKSVYIPEDGCILNDTEFEINENETVYDILVEAAKKYGISVDHKGGSDIIYISGINYLYELDYGDLSGWVYKVNGVLPSVGCASYKLRDGDRIEWCYTLDLGNDSLKE